MSLPSTGLFSDGNLGPYDVNMVSQKAIRHWCSKFGPSYAVGLRRRRAGPGHKWHLDEVLLKIRGKRHWLWRAVDQDGIVLDILIQERRDQAAAERFLRQLAVGPTRQGLMVIFAAYWLYQGSAPVEGQRRADATGDPADRAATGAAGAGPGTSDGWSAGGSRWRGALPQVIAARHSARPDPRSR